MQQVFSQNQCDRNTGVRIEGFYFYIPDLRTHYQRCIRGQCPRCGGPGQKTEIGIHIFKQKFRAFVADGFKLGHDGGVFHIAVAARLVQFVRTQPGSGGRRIGLDGVAFVQQPLVVNLFQQPPHGFYIAAVVSNIRVVHIHPVAHNAGEFLPLAGIFHHLLAAGGVVFFHRNFFSDVFLGNVQRFFHAQFHRQTVGVPAGFTMYAEAFHGFVAAENILNCAGHHVVDSRHSVGRWRSFVKHKCRVPFARRNTFMKRVVFFPAF